MARSDSFCTWGGAHESDNKAGGYNKRHFIYDQVKNTRVKFF